MAILLAFLGIRTGQEADIISPSSIGLLAGSGGLYVCALGLLISAIRTRSIEIGLTPQDAWEQAEQYRDYADMLYWWATESFIESISHNYQQYRQKLGLATAGFILLALQVAVGVAFMITAIA